MPTNHPLTPRQQQVLEFVEKNLDGRGYPPSLREISAHLRVTGTRAVEKHIAALEKKGRVRKGHGSRALTVVGRAHGRSVPIVGQVAAGQPILAEENLLGSLMIDLAVARWNECFLLKVKGESMKDAGILNGDMVLVKQQPDAETGEIVVALIDGEATVKRLYKRGRSIVLQPENPQFKPIWVTDPATFAIVGKVVGVFRF